MAWPSDHFRPERSLNVYVRPSEEVFQLSARAGMTVPSFFWLVRPSNIRPITWFEAVSLLSIELRVRMSVKLPSTTCPPFLGAPLVLLLLLVPAQASRNPTMPPLNAMKAAVPPARLRKSPLDPSSRNL